MVKFYCDRCGTEVDGLDALLEFSIDVTERPNRSLWHLRIEVCQECYDVIKEEVTSRIAPPPSAEENKKKGMRKVTP